jgi:pimeloyl-ACP methyl ester carboxylesterase
VAHATGFHSRCYRALAAALSDRFRVVGLDFRGHGHSAAPPLDADDDGLVPAMGWDRFADDVLAVVDGLGLEGAFGFGHSSGGAALLLAEERRPGTLAAIYAYEPIVASPEAWAGFDARGFDPASAARRRRPVFASRAAALENFSSKPPLSSLRADVLVDYVEGGFVDRPDGAVGLRCHPDAEAATYAMAARNDAWAHLGDIACPVVVGCGGARADFGADLAAALAARVPRGRVDEHAEVGHLGPLERPEEIAGSVAAALGR